MVLELHTWGPAFGLPSIDPTCVAATAYLNRTLPRDRWTLIADYDSSLSPQGELPLLVDADKKITGFTNIVSYLRKNYSHNLDADQTPQQQRDRTAFTSLLESTAGPLLDLYLYVSSENYGTTTSAAYTAILPWHVNYTIPPKRRDIARSRTAHLGLSSLDVAQASEDSHGPGRGTATSDYEAAKRAAGIPSEDRPPALHMGRGKGGLLSSPLYAARFKLDALSKEVLQPLADQLGKNKYLFGGDAPSSLDCLAFGYLSLLRYAPVPQAWVREAIQTKYPRLEGYLARLREELLHNEDIEPADVWSVATGKAVVGDFGLQLPWASRNPGAFIPQFRAVVHDGVLPHALQKAPTVRHGHNNPPRTARSSLPTPLAINTLATVTTAAAIGLAAFAVQHRRSPRDEPVIFWALRPLQPVFEGFGVESFLSALPR
ncbi:hypothetical protein DPSP01_001501 [Paraphaeosphaeria sporulosa]|uniref:Mitochondrial import receptor subunit n=1 Tax=Paraphaeosphaeria sporulosa TaxID=1460663 RepID=A0A177CGU9_9PLEO|nr:uncharacterized protein CC84DRAFT_1185938 [Paraphaeosphaeria sporulosa]OAG06793.1 hypothetical protein CC84DRAFT_1185938 [Paraphaeosphaeria sporulosa]